jgi:2-polyprenyl-6-methoxyphenol hydroxylase-like FAD-dependent oxidoreductase
VTNTEIGVTLGREALVIGGGIAGLLASRVLADFFETVTVLERDVLPAPVEPRKGVPQGPHVHAILRSGQTAIDELFPGFERELIEAGAVPLKPARDALVVDDLGRWPLSDIGPTITSQSRPLFEATIRRRAMTVARVAFEQGVMVRELIHADGRVTGVVCQDRGGAVRRLTADLVVDASGNAGQNRRWFEQCGFQPPRETAITVNIGYASCVFEIPHDPAREWLAIRVSGRAPAQGRLALMLPIEGGRWLLSVGGRTGDHPPGDADGFMAFVRDLPHPTIYDALRTARRLSPVARFGIVASRRYHFEELAAMPEGYLPVGDAFCVFNPIYGQGMGVAALQVAALHAALRERARSGPASLERLHAEYLPRVAALLATPWTMSAMPDLAFPDAIGERPPDFAQRLRMGEALRRLAQQDPSVRALLVDVLHLLQPPSVLTRPELLARAEPFLARDE